jgi:hypothetical protein
MQCTWQLHKYINSGSCFSHACDVLLMLLLLVPAPVLMLLQSHLCQPPRPLRVGRSTFSPSATATLQQQTVCMCHPLNDGIKHAVTVT